MPRAHDVIVAGLGAMGAATARELAGRGLRVLGLDRFRPPHALGSSHGEGRIIREAYFEHPLYVPFVQRAYLKWGELERRTGVRLLLPTGGLMIGPPEGVLVRGALESARVHRLRHELLSPGHLAERFPAFRPDPEMVAVWEPRAGVLAVEPCLEALLAEARREGAELRFDEGVADWRAEGSGVSVATAAGRRHAAWLVLAAGAWLPTLLGGLEVPLTVLRMAQHWFGARSRPELLRPDRLPVFVVEYEPGRFWYGLPDAGMGVKVALHYGGEATTAESVRREVGEGEIEAMRALLARLLPDANGEHRRSSVCLYTNTSDLHFLVDRHPGCPRVVVVSPCSGHGFKFAPVVGELVADLVCGRAPTFDLTPFGMGRLLA